MVDLRKGRLLPPDATKLITKRTLVAPDAPGTAHPRWSTFLDEATGGDAALTAFLQQMCGYCLTGDVTEEAIFFIWGNGGNGKGVFLRTVTAIIGDYAMAAGMATFMRSKHDAHTTEIARLQGARLVTASETEEGRSWAAERIKELTGNEQKITARFMHRDNFEFQPKLKLVFVGNHKPRLTTVDDAITRRLNLIPFTRKPVTINPHLKEQLVEEYPAILRWMIDGCLAWQQTRLQQPAVVNQATKDYLQDENTFGSWVRNCLELDYSAKTANVVLFTSWTRWCLDCNEYAGTNRGFAERVLQELPSCRRTNRTQRGETIQGVKVRSEAPTSASAPDTRSGAHKALQAELNHAAWFVGKDVAPGETGNCAAAADLLKRLSVRARTAAEAALPQLRRQFEAVRATLPAGLRDALQGSFEQATEAASRYAGDGRS
jgi:putative DNA primase/helicase